MPGVGVGALVVAMIWHPFFLFLAAVATWMLGYLPSGLLGGLDTTLSTSMSVVGPFLQTADYFAPVYLIAGLLVAIYGMRVAAIGWYMVAWLRRMALPRVL